MNNNSDIEDKLEKVKKEWLENRSSIKELPQHVENIIGGVDELARSKVKEYYENRTIQDENIKESQSLLSNAMFAAGAVIMSFYAVFHSQIGNESEILYLFSSRLIIILLIVISILYYCLTKKYNVKYAREKSFREIVVKCIEKMDRN